MYRLVPLLLLAATTFACSSGAEDEGSSQPAGTSASAPTTATGSGGLLFVLDAASATVTTADDGSTTLTLIDPHEQVVAFTDRPERSASTESLDDFVGRWDERGFAADPPNAAIATGDDIVVVTLSEPSLDGAGSITMTATPIAIDGIAGKQATADALSAEMGAVTVFVDPADASATVAVMRFEFSGAGTASILLENRLAPSSTEAWLVDVEGNASISAGQDSVSINFLNDSDNTTIVDLPVLLDGDGYVSGEADIDAGGTLSGQIVGADAPMTPISAGTPFRFTPNG
jgi:hypothetical protein